MKPTTYLSLISLFLISCGTPKSPQYPQYTLTLTNPDGTTDTYDMIAGSMLLVHKEDQHFVAKAGDGADKMLTLEVKSYGSTMDTTKNERMLKKTGTSTKKLALNQTETLGDVQMTVTKVTMLDSGRPKPQGKCNGACCVATCHSIMCCGDDHECKNTPCSCTEPDDCKGQDPKPNAAAFFDLFNSGKESMVLKSKE